MPMNEYRRLSKEARALVEETRRGAEELRKCVADSRFLIEESKEILAQSHRVPNARSYPSEGGDSVTHYCEARIELVCFVASCEQTWKQIGPVRDHLGTQKSKVLRRRHCESEPWDF